MCIRDRPGFEAYEWNGVFFPHGTPKAIVQKLNTGLNEALHSPEVTARFAQLNIVSRQNTPEEFHSFVEEQMKLWSGVTRGFFGCATGPAMRGGSWNVFIFPRHSGTARSAGPEIQMKARYRFLDSGFAGYARAPE